MTVFPNGTHDDQVDSTAQFLDWFKESFPGQNIYELYRRDAEAVEERRQPQPAQTVWQPSLLSATASAVKFDPDQSLAARFPRVAEPGISIAERDLKSGEHPARTAISGGAVCRVAASAGCGIAEGGWRASREGHAPHRRAARSETPPR